MRRSSMGKREAMSPNKKVRMIAGTKEEVELEVNHLYDLYAPLGFGWYVVNDRLVATATMILKSELPRAAAVPIAMPPGFDPRRQ